MGDASYAACDPNFWAHHCNVDRLWRVWQNRHGNATMPEEMMDIQLIPFNRTVRQVLDVNELGYEYAGASANG